MNSQLEKSQDGFIDGIEIDIHRSTSRYLSLVQGRSDDGTSPIAQSLDGEQPIME
jgi:hypothetical protein